jgi:hypothetical protein
MACILTASLHRRSILLLDVLVPLSKNEIGINNTSISTSKSLSFGIASHFHLVLWQEIVLKFIMQLERKISPKYDTYTVYIP